MLIHYTLINTLRKCIQIYASHMLLLLKPFQMMLIHYTLNRNIVMTEKIFYFMISIGNDKIFEPITNSIVQQNLQNL